jgi:hypothetical protein
MLFSREMWPADVVLEGGKASLEQNLLSTGSSMLQSG